MSAQIASSVFLFQESVFVLLMVQTIAHYLIGSTLPREIHGDNFNTKLTGDPVRISRAERIYQLVCRLYDLQSLNIQERTPPSAYFGNSILT